MTSNPVIQLPGDQFLHWRQDVKKKEEEQEKQMRELQDRVKHLQRENDRLWAQVEKRCNLGKKKKDMQDSSQAKHPIAYNKGKEHMIPDNIDTLADDELSSSSPPNLSLEKNSRAKSSQRRSHRPAFSNANGGTFCQARRETSQGQNQPNEVSGNASALHTGLMPPMPPTYLAYGTGHALYISLAVAIM